ncbi:uncharacterized protein GGS25DRAFT_523905 [Hypoxylon fragiforme]|uniref:uncharacterized protein n=1 Tax=Hypoxylon fragiforme TaxID=63214 RepID=UPI0020C714D0|nr:uncharacterized protein GGS25DRAFT_523905 [Hypoxylon fragiforme]KAI2606236.1 hypothetical protein GGS25DRAFT_523905 [Hypoxylon fragiforme]
MRTFPPSFLALLAAATQLRAQQQHHPTAIRKMSPDEGEKFFPEYYAFGPAPSLSPLLPRNIRATNDGEEEEEDPALLSSNATIPFQPPYPLHYDYHSASSEQDPALPPRRARDDVLARLRGRQFACPAGTHSCTNIEQPNYCCNTGTTCFAVTGAPESGNVGCCPEGQTCGLTVGACADGATSCPAGVGGGCCIPGFVCADVGCISSTITLITSPQTTLTSTILSTPTTTLLPPAPTTIIVTVLVTVTPAGGGAPVLSTTTQTTTASPSPSPPTSTISNVGGGGGIPPYRPTSGSSSTATTSEATSASYCPTGFYPCLAVLGGGCCRTGRDCVPTSCPPGVSSAPMMTTVVATNGATVAVPVTDAEAAAAAAGVLGTSTCAVGWFMCGSSSSSSSSDGATATAVVVGGVLGGEGCCPSGYACGTASCTLSASTATATVAKALPSSGGAAAAALPKVGVVAVGLGVVLAML